MKLLVVCGSAPCLKEDLETLGELYRGKVDFMAVGLDVAMRPVAWKYIATGHFEDIQFIHQYAALHNLKGYKLIHHNKQLGVDIIEPLENWVGGSSALLGVVAALKLGYNKIVLCGCPMAGPNPGHPGADYSMFQDRWVKEAVGISPHVRSMSGFTKDLLGSPEGEWLNE